jgi:hypothetical protein
VDAGPPENFWLLFKGRTVVNLPEERANFSASNRGHISFTC